MPNHSCSSGAADKIERLRAPGRPAAPRLVDEIDRKPATQKDGLKSFAAVWRGFPGFRRLTMAVPHHQRQLARVYRHLIEDIGMIAVQRLARGIERGRIVSTLLDRVELARCGDDRAAHGETALFLNNERVGLVAFGGKENVEPVIVAAISRRRGEVSGGSWFEPFCPQCPGYSDSHHRALRTADNPITGFC